MRGGGWGWGGGWLAEKGEREKSETRREKVRRETGRVVGGM